MSSQTVNTIKFIISDYSPEKKLEAIQNAFNNGKILRFEYRELLEYFQLEERERTICATR